ncbi:ATP-binding protein [Azospirillum sp. SYSU D00513]|uniref:hybrid sensor histidine kinase/response regulator n=1 Tax=Azospirillum sp. SYSU D00513 TaxID=2812561 RepID=UPI001A963360|nr:ATP-binding protein [Azospirillum sp. SYSU D00513]
MRIADTLSRLAELTNDGILVLAADPVVPDGPGPAILYANPAFLRLSGHAEEDLIGQPLSVLHGQATDRAALQRLFQALAQGRSHEEELVQYRRGGEPFWAALAAHPVTGEGGVRTGVMVVFRDITARRRAEQDIADRERRLTEIQRIAGLGWWSCDLRTRRLTYSDIVAAIFGRAPGAPPLGIDEVRAMIHPDDRRAAREALERGAAPCTFEVRVLRPHGEVRWVHSEVTVERDDTGKPLFLYGLLRDVTERQRTTEALRRAKEEAESANLTKSRFLAAASHDLRQPLNAMSLLLGVLRTRENAPGTAEVIDQLQQSLDAMMELFNALLDLSQFEMGAYRVNRSAVGLDRLQQRLSVDFAGPAEAKGVELRFVESQAALETDATLMERVLRNLLSNAIRYTPAGGRVLLGCRRRGAHWRIDVLDTGPGIPSEQIQAIFEEFHQLGNPARQREGGHGLGLAIVRRACDLLAHPLDVVSTPGRGTRFSVMVPAAQRSRPPAAEPETAKAVGDQAGCGAVLVIEDDPLVATAMRMMLEQYGCRVRLAQSGTEALEFAREAAEPFRLVLADFRLPGGMDGIAAVSGLRGAMAPHAVVGIVTGDLSEDIQSRAAQLGARCLIKPVRPDDLRALVEAARG